MKTKTENKKKKKEWLLSRLVKSLKEKAEARKLEKMVDQAAATPRHAHSQKISREARETVKLGCCTVTPMRDKKELKERIAIMDAENATKRMSAMQRAEEAWMNPPEELNLFLPDEKKIKAAREKFRDTDEFTATNTLKEKLKAHVAKRRAENSPLQTAGISDEDRKNK